jgi:hypothetical protein
MGNKITAVEWLILALQDQNLLIKYPIKMIRKAKLLEEEQIRDAHFAGSGCDTFDAPEDKCDTAYDLAGKYFNRFYGK